MSKNKRHRIIQKVTQQIVASQSYSGPLPRPEDFQRYEVVYPGAAQRILEYAEKEQKARHNALDKAQNIDRLKMILSFIILLSCIIIGSLLLFFGKNAEGLFVLVGSSALVAGNAVYRRGKKESEN